MIDNYHGEDNEPLDPDFDYPHLDPIELNSGEADDGFDPTQADF